MINKLKLGFLVAVLSLLGASFAHAAALNYSSATNISIGGYNYVISAGSVATTLTVSGNTIAVNTTGAAGSFTLTSAAGAYFNNDAGLASTCAGGSSTIVVPVTTSTTITPYIGTTCSSGGSGTLYSGSGTTTTSTSTTSSTTGTTGGSTSVPPVTVTVTPVSSTPMTQTDAGCVAGNKYSTVSGQLCTSSLVSTSSGKTYNFGIAVLKQGSKGDGVKELQRFLNDTLNLGLALDGKLGPKTIAVIKKWQKDHGLVADGKVGAKTKAQMSASVK